MSKDMRDLGRRRACSETFQTDDTHLHPFARCVCLHVWTLPHDDFWWYMATPLLSPTGDSACGIHPLEVPPFSLLRIANPPVDPNQSSDGTPKRQEHDLWDRFSGAFWIPNFVFLFGLGRT